MKMEPAGVHFVLAAAGILLQASGGSAAPMQCHFDSRGKNMKILEKMFTLKKGFMFISYHHVLLQLYVCSREDNTQWVKPGWTTHVCSAPVCTLSAWAAARRMYMDNLFSS